MSDLALPREDVVRISRILWPEWAAHDRDGPIRVVRRILEGVPVGGIATEAEVLKVRELARLARAREHPAKRVRCVNARELRFGQVLDVLDGQEGRQP